MLYYIRIRVRLRLVDPTSLLEGTLRTKIFYIAVCVLLGLVSATIASAQEKTLADAAMPSTVLFGDAVNCLVGAAQVLSPKDAAKFCENVRREEADRAKAAAKAAADAGKVNFWDCMRLGMCPDSYSRSYRSYGGYGYTQPDNGGGGR